MLSFDFVNDESNVCTCAFCGRPEASSDFLVAQPSFLHGFSNVFSVFGPWHEYNYSISPEIADAFAIYSDWNITGHDLCRVIEVKRSPKEQATP
jgi:hypothetical protein